MQYVCDSLLASVMFMAFNSVFPGTIIDFVYRTDVDECLEGTHNCSAECMNIPGGFLCECSSGYLLSEDGVSCIGT